MSVQETLMQFIAKANQVAFEHTEYLLLILPSLLLLFIILGRGKFTRKKTIFLIKRFFLFSLLIAAIASPYILESESLPRELPPMIILSDASSSMGLYGNYSKVPPMLRKDLESITANLSDERIKVAYVKFSPGNSTAIGDAIYTHSINSEKVSNLFMLFTDGQNLRGRNPLDVSRAIARTNSSILVVKPVSSSPEIFVSDIVGQKKIPVRAQYPLYVQVNKVSNQPVSYKLEVFVDSFKRSSIRETQTDQVVYFPLTLNFNDVGVHEIKVELTPSSDEQDTFPENNVLYHSVEVIDKPRLLVVVGNETSSPLVEVLDSLYEVTVTRTLPINRLGEFNAIILDNVHTKNMVRGTVEKLRDYILDGNGVLVVGGRNSFEHGGYYNSDLENLLPVTSTPKPKELRKPISVIFVMDISGSFEWAPEPNSKETKLDVEKALVIKVMKDMKDEDIISVMAMSGDLYVIQPPQELGPIRNELTNKILSLQYGGGTLIKHSLEKAGNIVKNHPGKKFIILMTDGMSGDEGVSQIAQSLADNYNIKIYTVGIGYGSNLGEYSLREIASAGQGLYIKPNAYQRLKLEFGKEKTEGEDVGTFPLAIRDQYHFITHDLRLPDSYVTDFNKVFEKSSSRVLITAEGDQPVLTIWRFGLGRVAVLSTDNGLYWAPRIYESEEARLISGVTNWVLGDMEKHKRVRITSHDAAIGEEADISVKSETRPTLTLQESVTGDLKSMLLKRTEPDTYKASFTPQTSGFYGLLASIPGQDDVDLVAVNYPLEYSRLGVNEDILASIADSSNGQLYGVDEIDQLKKDIFKYVQKETVEEIKEKKQLWHLFILLALILYFIDTIIMRTREIFKKR
ncbi:VWA domain-containing protein [Candidatus Altiarchaeota archaeon]